MAFAGRRICTADAECAVGSALRQDPSVLAAERRAALAPAQALTISTGLAQTRWLLVGQSGHSIPRPFLVVLVCWLGFIFVSFGLYVRLNTTVVMALFVCALSFSSAIFLILELEQPFEGLIQISAAPMRETLARLGQ